MRSCINNTHMGFGEIFAQHSTHGIAQLGRELHVCIPTLSKVAWFGIWGPVGFFKQVGSCCLWMAWKTVVDIYIYIDKASNVANRISINISTYFNQRFDILHRIISRSCPNISFWLLLCAGKIRFQGFPFSNRWALGLFQNTGTPKVGPNPISFPWVSTVSFQGYREKGLQLHQWQYDCFLRSDIMFC